MLPNDNLVRVQQVLACSDRERETFCILLSACFVENKSLVHLYTPNLNYVTFLGNSP